MNAPQVVLEPTASTPAALKPTDREALAKRVANAFGQAFAKLAAHKTDIEQLWIEFANLEDGATIMGCTTKTQFCDEVLGRSIRTVQYMLNGRESQAKPRELCSPAIEVEHTVSEPLGAYVPSPIEFSGKPVESPDDEVDDTISVNHTPLDATIEIRCRTKEDREAVSKLLNQPLKAGKNLLWFPDDFAVEVTIQ